MFARARPLVRAREEEFGATIYVSDRDDIFLVDNRIAQFLKSFSSRWKAVSSIDEHAAAKMAELGILDLRHSVDGNPIEQKSYSGIHLLGDFLDIPLVRSPLLVNCFSTAWCPLKCAYCHADDLMGPELRANETDDGVDKVASSASRLNALVYVITGGDPITRPKRAIRLAEQIREDAGVVIDTSGVGNISEALALVKLRPMHLRVSIDSMDPRINKKTRPLNPELKSLLQLNGGESLDMASRLIDEGGPYATGVTVQTVISSKNDTAEHLFQFRDWLISRGVRNWVLHATINAGAARRFSIRPSKKKVSEAANASHGVNRKSVTILPNYGEVSRAIRQLIDATSQSNLPIDIRCTDANTAPNSVFLIGSEGEIYTQGRGGEGGRKVKLFEHGNSANNMNSLWTYVGCLDHVQRYINFVPMIHGNKPTSLQMWS